ncbi:hypothetical protein PBY51_009944 [Eleginops maclovinus]|uniref:Uncharacterized protein n=1 Tax=Eleginops maclovinus TaxID=56733 RepID=A0AAN8AQV6_ELEMC|nr:hypothetical protein PBY51_009944 [Eleginops maclovinus]
MVLPPGGAVALCGGSSGAEEGGGSRGRAAAPHSQPTVPEETQRVECASQPFSRARVTKQAEQDPSGSPGKII